MPEIDMQERFPEMRPVRSAPALFRVNGCGVGMYGRRDDDDETRTFVKTWCISLLFIPLLALRAYRVAAAKGGGWYFLGRVPLSGTAKVCNVLVLAGIASMVGRAKWKAYSATPEYRAAAMVAEGGEQAAGGEPGRAARTWKKAVLLSDSVRDEVGAAMRGLLDGELGAAEAAAVYEVAIFFQQRPQGPHLGDDLASRGLALARTLEASAPQGALALVDVVAPLAPAEEVRALGRALLERLVEAKPGDLGLAVRLASLLETEGDADGCIALLERHGATSAWEETEAERVRILGLAYAARERYDEAFALLGPYVDARLADLHRAQTTYDDTVQRVWDLEVRRLERGFAPRDLDFRYNAAKTEEERGAIVQEHLVRKVNDDPEVARHRARMERLGGVVPVALELGHVRLRRAQRLADADARRAELEEAEKTFLAIQTFAGESDEYRLFLGQVRCWLGNHEDGHALFDELLVDRERAPATLVSVAVALREIGAVTEARALSEEAWQKETDTLARHEVAFLRAVMFEDTDDRIEWLGRADPANPRVSAALSMALGDRAFRDGDDAAAAERYRKALAALGELPESSATLNDMALAWQSVYRATGDRSALERAAPPLERALLLEASSTILRSNLVGILADIALRDVVGDAVDVEAVRVHAGFDTLAYLYSDEATRRPVVERLLAHPRFREAVAHTEKVLLMAPENANAVGMLAHVHSLSGDLEGVRRLHDRAAARRYDLGDSKEKSLALYRGEEAEDERENAERSRKRARGRMDTARAKGGATLAVAALALADAILAARNVGLDGDLDEVVRLADEAHAAAPSAATLQGRIRARFHRALRDVVAAHPRDAESVRSRERILGASLALALLLDGGGPPAATALDLRDVKDAVEDILRQRKAFPADPAAWHWPLLKASRPDGADGLAAALREDALKPVLRGIQLALVPWDAATAYQSYWHHRALGDEEEGRAVLKRCAAEGVPLPMPAK